MKCPEKSRIDKAANYRAIHAPGAGRMGDMFGMFRKKTQQSGIGECHCSARVPVHPEAACRAS